MAGVFHFGGLIPRDSRVESARGASLLRWVAGDIGLAVRRQPVSSPVQAVRSS